MHQYDRALLAAALLLAAAGVALAQNMSVGMGTGDLPTMQSQPGTPAPPCSNSLDFSDSCNSQYFGAL